MPEYHTGTRIRDSPVLDDENTVDEDIIDTVRILMRIRKSRPVLYGIRVEYHQICAHALGDTAPIRQSKTLRRQERHLSHGFFQSQRLIVPNIFCQDTGKRAVITRMDES